MEFEGLKLSSGTQIENLAATGGNSVAQGLLTPSAGELFFRTDVGPGELQVYDGASWQALGSGEWTVSGSDIYYNTGNVGIGTSDIEAWLGNAIEMGVNSLAISDGNNSSFSRNCYYDGSWKRKAGTGFVSRMYTGSFGDWYFQGAANSTIDSVITWQTLLSMDTNGRFGFDATSVAGWHTTYAALQIGNSGAVTSSANRAEFHHNSYYANSGSVYKYIAADEAAMIKLQQGVITLSVAVPGAAAGTITWDDGLTIDNDGYVGIGETPNAGWAFYDAIQLGSAASISGDANYTTINHNLYAYGNNAWKHSTTNIASLYQQAGGDHVFYSSASVAAGTTATLIKHVTFDELTNLYLGTMNRATGTQGVIHITNATVNPSANPVGGGVIFTDTGALKYRGTSGASVTVANADGTLPQTDLGEFIIASLPTASANANSYALATDAAGGRTIVRSDGTNWKIVVVEGATVA